MIHPESVKGHLRIFLLGEVDPPAEEVAEKVSYFVIPNEVRNLSGY
jgi:hypothetical protein